MTRREKTYRHNPPTGKQLATIVYERCANNVERYRRSHKSVKIYFAPMSTSRDRESVGIYITGRTLQDEKRWESEFLYNWERKNKYPGNAMLLGRKKNWSPEGVLPQDGQGYASDAGWEIDVEIFVGTTKAPIFDMHLNQFGNAPSEILQCLKSTYNELISEYG